MTRTFAVAVLAASLAACATFQDPDPANLASYCTPETAYRLGTQSKAYFGVCPKETEAAFLAGLQRGRALRPSPPQAWPYFQQMEELEKQIMAAPSEADKERLRERLRTAEFWAVHIVNSPATYSVDN